MTTSSANILQAIPPSLRLHFAPLIRLSDEIEDDSPRVACLCRIYALERAHRLDPQSSKSPGLKQFKIHLTRRLERDNTTSLVHRLMETDALEIQSFYSQYFEKQIRVRRLDQLDKATYRAEILKAHETAALLFQVLCAVNSRELVEVSPEIIAAVRVVRQKHEARAPPNILPPALIDDRASQATIQQEAEDHSMIKDEEAGIGWSGRTLKLLKHLQQLKHLKVKLWIIDWLFRRRPW